MSNTEDLYIGCVDARRPLGDFGMNISDMHVLRSIAAYLPANDPDVEAALQRAIKDGVKRITVAGHTDCGGVCACADRNTAVPAVLNSLETLAGVRDRMEKAHPKDKTARLRHMECAVVHETMKNLRSYACVREAEAKGELNLRGWLIDIANGKQHDITHSDAAPDTTKEFPAHNPHMLLLSGMDPSAPVATLGINKGDSLIVRNYGAFIKNRDPRTAAVLEFAVNAKGVKKIALALEEDSKFINACLDEKLQTPAFRQYIAPIARDIQVIRATHPDDLDAQKKLLEKRVIEVSLTNLRSYAPVGMAKHLEIEVWRVNKAGGKTIESTLQIGSPEGEKKVAGARRG